MSMNFRPSFFLTDAVVAMNVPLNPSLAAPQKSYIVFSSSFCLKSFLNSLLISPLIHELFRSASFHFQIVVIFLTVINLQLNFIVIREYTLYAFHPFKFIEMRFLMSSVMMNRLCALKKNKCYAFIGCDVLERIIRAK